MFDADYGVRDDSIEKQLGMDALEVASPLLGVVVGGLLTGVTAYFRHRKERKRVIALALSDLLEVRHRMVAVESVVKKMLTIPEFSPEQVPQFRSMLDSIIPNDPGLDARYDTAVSLLAGIDPVLAFRMRSRNTSPKMFGALRTLTAAYQIDPAVRSKIEVLLEAAVSPQLDLAIVELARAHSFSTSREVKKIIAKADSLPTVVNDLFEQMSPSIPPPSSI
ncbi:MAG: hypothetical protein V4693_21005 [Pseudomonadota bacterium]